jgi:hypothetical protein
MDSAAANVIASLLTHHAARNQSFLGQHVQIQTKGDSMGSS